MENLNLNNIRSRNLYFLIGKRSAKIGSETFITVAVLKPLVAGSRIDVEGFKLKVTNVLEERDFSIKGLTFQKLNVLIIEKPEIRVVLNNHKHVRA